MKHFFGSIALALSALVVAGGAQAQTAYDLRAMNLFGNIPANAGSLNPYQNLNDRFNNGNPSVGPEFTNGVSGTAAYTAFGTPQAGAEMLGPAGDFFGLSFGVGRMRFQQSDAAPSPSNLDAPGVINVRESLTLNNPSSASLLTKAQSFEIGNFWNFVIPDLGSTYGLRLSDNPNPGLTPGVSFNDLIDLNLVSSSTTGAPVVRLRRLSYDGTSLSQPEAYFLTVAGALIPGKSLTDIAIIGFQLDYSAATGNLTAVFNLTDANGNDIAKHDASSKFSQSPSIFNGEAFTFAIASAGWNAALAVPEPASWALMLMGVAGLAVFTRRRGRGRH